MSENLSNIREQLDEIDGRLIEALADRQKIIEQVAALKARNGRQVRDLLREEEIITRLNARARKAGLNNYFVTSLFQKILDYSVRYQMDHITDQVNPDRPTEQIVVAFQGAEGGDSHLAAQHHFSSREAELVCRGFTTLDDAVAMVTAGDADYAVLPIENTTAGSINETYDLLARTNLHLVGEEVLKVDPCLVAIAPIPLHLIRRISSHPQALEQCSTFLTTLKDCKVDTYLDTALAARKIRDDDDLSHAAIASEEAARRYGLHILKRQIANHRDNFTRYVIVARTPVAFDPRIPCKTSLIFATPHEQGALMRCLNVFAAHDINLSKLESRPRQKTAWEYLFYVDVEGNSADDKVAQALQELTAVANFMKVLGSYPTRTKEAKAAPTPPASEAARQAAPAPAAPPPPKQEPSVAAILAKKPYKLASRLNHPEDTQILVGNVVIGGPQPVMIAGPCAVESREQVMACAAAIRDHGGHIMRGGCFKPRTSPYAFQGMGYEGLTLLREAGEAYDLPIITEVLHPSDVIPISREADILQIGARNMQNFALLKEVGQVDRPVMLKRGMMASIDEWLAAAEYILAQGNQQVILCERGIRSFETATRNTLDLSAVPVVRERTHLPILVDPSHACGVWRWVTPLANAALAAGAQGVMVEIHPTPEAARCDGPQALKFDTFARFAEQFHRYTVAT